MSVTDPQADPVQPEGQGGEGNEAPYAEYLDRIPTEVRDQVEPVFKDWDANVTRRFQDSAEYRKTWEPYEQLGVSQIPPDEMQWHLTFREALQNNPEAVVEWVKDYAQERGITFDQAVQETQQQQQEPGFEDYGTGFDPSALEQMLQKQLQPLQQSVEQINAWREQQEERSRFNEASQLIDEQVRGLQDKPGFDREMLDVFLNQQISSVRPGEDPRVAVPRAVQAAWSALEKFRSQIEKGVLQTKANVPPGAEHGGAANAAPEPIRSLADANRVAEEMLRQRQS